MSSGNVFCIMCMLFFTLLDTNLTSANPYENRTYLCPFHVGLLKLLPGNLFKKKILVASQVGLEVCFCKNLPRITYKVSSGTLSLYSLTHSSLFYAELNNFWSMYLTTFNAPNTVHSHLHCYV